VSHADLHDDLLAAVRECGNDRHMVVVGKIVAAEYGRAAGFNIRQIIGFRVVQVSSVEKVNGKSLPFKVFFRSFNSPQSTQCDKKLQHKLPNGYSLHSE